MANTSDEMRQYREAFSLFDKDHDDIIAPQELGNYTEFNLLRKKNINKFKALFFVHVVYHHRKLIYKKFNNKLVVKLILIPSYKSHRISKQIIAKLKMIYAKHSVYLIKMELVMLVSLNSNMQ